MAESGGPAQLVRPAFWPWSVSTAHAFVYTATLAGSAE